MRFRAKGSRIPALNRFFSPRWAYLLIGYTVFLWASIVSITMKSLRADMLMAVFVLLAMGMLLRIRELGASWRRYLLLGAILGLGYPAKTPIPPIGILILVSGVILARDWKRALPKAVVTGAVSLAISIFYSSFVETWRLHPWVNPAATTI